MTKFSKILSTSCALVATSLIFVGCLTSKTTTTNPTTGTVTTNTVVNQANLLLDTSILQGATSIAVSVAVQKDPSVVPALQNVQVALTGILNGANTNTTSQVLAVLGKSSNPTLVTEITPLINTVSGLEQSLLAKYGTNVSGTITLAIAKAVDAGLIASLPVTK
jgi:hypothetical protein